MVNPNQKGFLNLTTVLLLIIVVSIGGVGYFVYSTNKLVSSSLNAGQGVNQPVAQNRSPQITDKSAALSTYTSKYTGAIFDFPKAWKTHVQLNAAVKKEFVTIKSPSGKIIVTWDSDILGVGSDCTDEIAPGKNDPSKGVGCPAWENTSVVPLAYGHGLSVVQGWSNFDDQNYSVYAAVQAPDSELIGNTRGPMFTFYQFGGHRSSLDVAIVYTGKANFTSSAAASEFMQSNPEYKEAVQAISTLAYH